MPLTPTQIEKIRNKWFWCMFEGKFYILQKSEEPNTIGEMTSPQENGTTNGLRIYYTSKAAHFTAQSDNSHLATTSEIPAQFHEALCHKVISDGYKIPGDTYNLNNAQYFDNQYELQVREGKKYAKRNHSSTGTIIPVDY